MQAHYLTWYYGIKRPSTKYEYLKIVLFLFIILVTIRISCAATLSGNVYDISLNPLNNVIVTINTQPPQQMIVKDGSYSFEVPEGRYNITAKYYEDNFLRYEDCQEVEIRPGKQYGVFVYDLILFPSLEEDTKLYEDSDLILDTPYEESNAKKIIIAAAGLVILIILVFLGYKVAKKISNKTAVKQSKADEKKKEEKNISEEKQGDKENKKEISTEKKGGKAEDSKESKADKENKESSDEYYDLVLKMIKEHKRITQKEIRKEVPLSEAKISLIISEMEHRGIIEKIKKGRGNIIVLK